MTKRLVLRTLKILPAALKSGVLLPQASRTVAVLPGGEVGTLDVVIEQEFEYEEPKKEGTG